MGRSAEEVKARCSEITGDKTVISLVKESSSPSAAFDMIFTKTKDQKKAKAGRWLAILRCDYLNEYQKIITT